MRKTGRRLAAFALAGVVLAACSTSSSPTTTSGAAAAPTTTATQPSSVSSSATTAWPAACTLVTPADITGALGTAPVVPPSSNEPTQCYYSSPTAPHYVNASVEIVVLTKFFAQSATSAGATESVSGLGDAAYETPVGSGAGSLLVLKGKKDLRIDVYLPVTAATQAAMQHLAKLAITRVG